MSDAPIVIHRGLPDQLREQSAVLFDEAFGAKMGMAVPDRDKRVAFLERTFRASHAVVAIRGDELVGMVGLSASEGTYRGGLMDVSWDPRALRDLLGVIGSFRAAFGMQVADHRPEPGELYVDGIAVSPEARGQGIGSRLLDEVAAIAREDSFRWVRLDVVDINPRAQALYERVGYEVTKVQTFGYMRRIIGFGGVTSMELPIGDVTATDKAS
jgi:ribosomal protein S18 acetylase RimI-like enzyme